jgi:hypothetical protein
LGERAEGNRSFDEYSELRAVSVGELKMQFNKENEMPENRYCLRISIA